MIFAKKTTPTPQNGSNPITSREKHIVKIHSRNTQKLSPLLFLLHTIGKDYPEYDK